VPNAVGQGSVIEEFAGSVRLGGMTDVVVQEPPADGAVERRRIQGAQCGAIGLALGALGIVFGDIGTSPLYALQPCSPSTMAPCDPPRATSTA